MQRRTGMDRFSFRSDSSLLRFVPARDCRLAAPRDFCFTVLCSFTLLITTCRSVTFIFLLSTCGSATLTLLLSTRRSPIGAAICVLVLFFAKYSVTVFFPFAFVSSRDRHKETWELRPTSSMAVM